MRGLRSRWILALLTLFFVLPAFGAESRLGKSAEALFSRGGMRQVKVSPTGDWILAYGLYGVSHGILVQSTATGETSHVFSTRIRLSRIDWIGRNTIVADFKDGFQRRTMVARFRETALGLDFDIEWIESFGYLLDPLPLVEDEVIWVVRDDRQTALHRVHIQKLIEYGTGGHRRQLQGTRIALLKGQIYRWVVDRDGNPVAAQRKDEEGSTILTRVEGSTRFKEVYSFKDEDDDATVNLLALTPNQRRIIVYAYNGNDTRGLFEFDPATGELGELLFHREGVDVSDVLMDSISGEMIAAIYEVGGNRRYHYFAAFGSSLIVDLRKRFPKDSIRILSTSADRSKFVFGISGATNPGVYYYRDTRSGTTIKIADRGAGLDLDSLREVDSFLVNSKDGTEIEAFLTLPEPNPDFAAPLVVMPHGGPIDVRDRKQFDPLVQYLASWGFAILQPNYRGSSGYGLKFTHSAKKAWATGIEDDIDAAVEYAMALPEIDGNRVCIYGWSYGGFSALASIVRHKDRYRCAVSVNGVSDIPLMADSSDIADTKSAMKYFENYIGDLETESGRAKLIAASPAYHVQEIETPLLLIFGTEDRRVDPDNSHRMLLMLETYGKEHDSIEMDGMFHGATRDEYIRIARAIRRYLTRFLFSSEEFQHDPIH